MCSINRIVLVFLALSLALLLSACSDDSYRVKNVPTDDIQKILDSKQNGFVIIKNEEDAQFLRGVHKVLLEKKQTALQFDWFTILATLGIIGFTLFSISLKLARLFFELAFNYILSMIIAPIDVHDGQKTKMIIQSILNTFMVIIMIFLSMKVYMIGTAYLEDTLPTFTYVIALIAFSIAVIDGPNMVERLFGIDAGLKSGWGTLGGAYAGAKVAGGLAGMTGPSKGKEVVVVQLNQKKIIANKCKHLTSHGTWEQKPLMLFLTIFMCIHSYCVLLLGKGDEEMEVRISDVDPVIVSKIDKMAEKLNQSRQVYLKAQIELITIDYIQSTKMDHLEKQLQANSRALRTHKGAKPIFISCGNYIDLQTTTEITLNLINDESRSPIPGWYETRTIHIHMKVFVGEKEVLTSQLFFPQGFNYMIQSMPPYNVRYFSPVINENDFVLRDSHGVQGAWPKMSRKGQVYMGTLTIGVMLQTE